jgi:hypothetical protein
MAFTMPSFPIIDIPSPVPKDLIANALNAYATTKYQFPLEQIKLQYAPLTTLAEASSKLAYANLLGPQFVAKLLANPAIRGNIPDPILNQAIKSLVSSGMSPAGTSQNPYMQQALSQAGIGGLPRNQPISYTQPATEQTQYQPSVQTQQTQYQPSTQIEPQETTTTGGYEFPGPKKTFAERAGEQQGIIKEEEELGKVRAGVIKSLGEDYKTSDDRLSAIDQLIDTVNTPAFASVRQVPIGQQYELAYYSKLGNKDQQQVIGNFITQANRMVAESIKSFGGNKLKGEVDISKAMKVGDHDTLNVILGKLQAARVYEGYKMARARYTAQIMQKEHMNEIDALEKADKMIHGPAIRRETEEKLNLNDPFITITNDKGESKFVRVTEARALLRKKKGQ